MSGHRRARLNWMRARARECDFVQVLPHIPTCVSAHFFMAYVRACMCTSVRAFEARGYYVVLARCVAGACVRAGAGAGAGAGACASAGVVGCGKR